jgi:CheY-like chemotaxis protein
MQVVVVDDMEANRIIVENLLPRYGATVHGFADGEALLNALSEFDGIPDLFLLDINMPGMKGDEVLRAIKACSPELAQVPAFAMSASLNFAGSEQVINLFTGLFSKPFSVGQLLTLARQYAPPPPAVVTVKSPVDPRAVAQDTNQMRRASDVAQSSAEGAYSAEGSYSADGSPSAEGAYSAEGSNPDVDLLIEEMGIELAIELTEAFKSSLTRALTTEKAGVISAEQVVDVAHALKPTAGMLGFVELSRCCQEIDGLRSSGDIGPAIERRVELLSKIEMTRVLVERLLDHLKTTSKMG